MSRLLTIGETMGVADTGDPLRTARGLRPSTAGAESTVAIGMRRLGHEVAWLGVVGDDELGARAARPGRRGRPTSDACGSIPIIRPAS